MSSTVVVRGSGGAIFEMDVPAAGHALELHQEKVAKGDIVIIDDPVEWVDNPDGSRSLVLVAPSADAPRRGRTPKATVVVEESPTPEEE